MPPAVAAAAITAAATIGGGVLANKGQGKAANAQKQAADAALGFERDKETRRRQEYDQAMTEYRQRYAQWEQQRNGLLARYGVHPGARPSLASFGQGPSPTMGQGPAFGPQGMGAPSMGAPGMGPTQSLLGGAPRRLSLADFSGQRPGAI